MRETSMPKEGRVGIENKAERSQTFFRFKVRVWRKNKGGKKCNTTMNLTGCDLPFLKGYLEEKFTEGMTWENHGKWHIAHIKPCCSFNLEDEDEQKKCFHYSNLQPLWARDNLSKGGK